VPTPNAQFVAVAGGDFAEFADCLLGPDVTLPAGCEEADIDPDDDADLADLAKIQTLITGSH
jgi:hypothetical protein